MLQSRDVIWGGGGKESAFAPLPPWFLKIYFLRKNIHIYAKIGEFDDILPPMPPLILANLQFL